MILGYVFCEAFYGASKPTSGQFICQKVHALQRNKLLTDTICYAFLNVVKEVTGQDSLVTRSCDLEIISSGITPSIYMPIFYKNPPQF